MIGRLKGVLVIKQPPELMIDVQGVGYELEAPMSSFYQLPEVGGEVTLFTHLAIRDDAHQLYGFVSQQERMLFRALIKVNGVGPKLALTILSGMETKEFVQSVQRQDTATLVKLPGVGKKTAERLLIEMRDRLKGWETDSGPLFSEPSGQLEEHDVLQDAVSALQALGYKAADAEKVIKAHYQAGASREELIRLALKGMVK
ncbi:Holliday junction branch migration protein RuvA [Zooshikella ganghwensis]|uniref:Holliday junction branch migration complex subunit RuvA n=1 Tax=Zooshikella ganghwensis TaxID=202772 RepID=A0A4P9VKQ0_9GAMM|nr:Holliday junction branch migration protein RuvA [Zooshikella ganghwensis]RDH43099.1 Holliday junction branch migration protein RuvA [Zooshikella ganghwensis]